MWCLGDAGSHYHAADAFYLIGGIVVTGQVFAGYFAANHFVFFLLFEKAGVVKEHSSEEEGKIFPGYLFERSEVLGSGIYIFYMAEAVVGKVFRKLFFQLIEYEFLYFLKLHAIPCLCDNKSIKYFSKK